MNLDYYTDTKVDGSQEDKCCQVKGEFVCQRNGSPRTTSGPAPHRCQDAPLTALGDPEHPTGARMLHLRLSVTQSWATWISKRELCAWGMPKERRQGSSLEALPSGQALEG